LFSREADASGLDDMTDDELRVLRARYVAATLITPMIEATAQDMSRPDDTRPR
jgi:hypothetical protein